jgi:predicted nuclease with TOPRIM domain
MSEEIKFTEEEMGKIKEFQTLYINIQQSLGQLSVARIRLEQQLENFDNNEEDMKNKFVETQKNERDFITEITKKYGDGTFNPETGTFIPNKS